MSKNRVTIVGAGLAGMMAARELEKEGDKEIVLVDSGESVGGRLATKRVSKGRADHGAQFFTVRSKELEEDVQHWLENGWIKQWYGEKYPRYTAVKGMSGLAKQLSKGHDVLLHTEVKKLAETDTGFRLYDGEGRSWESGQILLAMPVPKIVQLVKSAETNVDPGVMKALRKITYHPVYVGIFHFKSETDLPEHGHLDRELPEGIERIVDHRKKGISEETIVSVYMTGQWSRNHYGEDYVLTLMKEKAASYLDWEDLESEQIKRWRYAEAIHTYPASYADLTGDGKIVAAGDAFLRPDDEAGRTRFESAYLSGKDAAAYLSGNKNR